MILSVPLVYGLCFGSVAVAAAAGYPLIEQRMMAVLRQQSARASGQLEEMFLNLTPRTLLIISILSPVVCGGLAWLLSEKLVLGGIGAVLGLFIPRILLKQMDVIRRNKFHAQLVDGLLPLPSSLKAGLSMLQAFGVAAEEMPPPLSQEFGLMLKETRMGVNLDEAIKHMRERMPSDDMTLFVTAVLVGRESGGDVTHIFGRLVETLRERKKIKDKIKTLTFMAKLQGIIMGMLPFAFCLMVYQMDHNYFQFFIKNEMGKILLAVIIAMQVVGTVLFMRFSRSPL